MSTKGRGFLLAASLAGLMIGAAPALAQSHGGGGGGGHAGGGGGGHMSGGGHVSGGAAHASAGHFGGGAHYAAAGGGRGYGGAGYAHGYPAGFHGGAGIHGGYGHPGGFYGHGYSTGAYWRGGYWRGGFWPRAYYGIGFSWFLPILPLAYATYWYGGVPYYYANDVYYTYSPSYDGYVATDPPPAADSGSAGPAPGGDTSAAPGGAPGAGDPGAAGQIFMYPKNGQSAEQQATDKAECQQWAAQQAGQVAQNGSDYMRAMTACVEGRGYSAR